MRVGSFRSMEDHVHAKTRIVGEEDDVKKQIVKDEKEALECFPFDS